MSARFPALIRACVLPVSLILLAEAAAWITGFRSDSLDRPSRIFLAGLRVMLDGSLLADTLETLAAALGGLVIGLLCGTFLGILLGVNRWLDQAFLFPVEILRSIPIIAILPVPMMIFGLGYRMEIFLVAIATVWPMLLFTRAAIVGMEPRLLEVARVLELGFARTLVKIILPSALPRLFVAFRLSASLALVVAVTVEVTANQLGLGYAMMSASQSLNPDIALAMLVWIAIVGWALNLALVQAQERLFGAAARSKQ